MSCDNDVLKGDFKLSNPKSGGHFHLSVFLKRMMDLIISLSIIIICAPFFTILIILTALNGEPPFYTQRRVGLNGRAKGWLDSVLLEELARHGRFRDYYSNFSSYHQSRWRVLSNTDLRSSLNGAIRSSCTIIRLPID
jgi:hypothetical protein